MNVEFKIAMDAEQKRLGNVKDVNLEVSFDDVDFAIVQKHAVANMIVQWQNQIRSHWTDFVNGKMPTEIKFGDPLFEGGRRATVRTMSMEEMITHINNMPDEERTQYIIKLQMGQATLPTAAEMIRDSTISTQNAVRNAEVGEDSDDEPPTNNHMV